MICAGREPLRGRVEVNEAYVGGQREGTRRRGAEGKTAVLVAVEGQAKKKLGDNPWAPLESRSHPEKLMPFAPYPAPSHRIPNWIHQGMVTRPATVVQMMMRKAIAGSPP